MQPTLSHPAPVDQVKRRAKTSLYSVGEPCRRGHTCGRYISNGRCVECVSFHVKKAMAKVPLDVKVARSKIACRKSRLRRKGTAGWWAQDRCNALRGKAKARGLPFDLTADYIFACIPADFICPILGIPLVFGGDGSFNPNSASVDRINPRLGYICGNIRVISNRANILKRDVTDAEELQMVVDDLRRQY
jgi:hypothetical protein